MNLKEMRKNLGLSPEQLAVACGVSLGTIRNWETGRTAPTGTADDFIKWGQAYNCSLADFADAARKS